MSARKFAERRPWTPLEADRVRAFARVTFVAGSPHKRFARNMLDQLTHREAMGLTDAQAEQIERLAWRFRRQMPAALVPMVNPFVGGGK